MKCILCGREFSENEKRFFYLPEDSNDKESFCCASCYASKLANLQLGREEYAYKKDQKYFIEDDIIIFEALIDATKKVQQRYGIANWKLKNVLTAFCRHYDELVPLDQRYSTIYEK